MLAPVPDKKLTGFQRTVFTCDKCKKQIGIETDYLSEIQARNQHKCNKGGKSEQKKAGKL